MVRFVFWHLKIKKTHYVLIIDNDYIIIGQSFLRCVFTVYDYGDLFKKYKKIRPRIGFADSRNLYGFDH